MTKTIAIVGAGRGLGLAIARRFGRDGFRVALIARNGDRLVELVETLAGAGVEAAAFPADMTDEVQLDAAFAGVRERFGPVDVLEFSPGGVALDMSRMSPLTATPDIVREEFDFLAVSAIASARHVLPDMLERGTGTIFFTMGASAHTPVPLITPHGMGMAASRYYALCLNSAVADKGVHVAAVCIGGFIKAGDPILDPDAIAGRIFDLYLTRDQAELRISAGVDPTVLASQIGSQSRA